MRKWRWIAGLAALAMVALPVASASLPAAAQDKTVVLTVYNQNMALVSENRSVPLEAGLNEVVYTDVAAQIDPTSVSFKSLTDPTGTTVLEQNFEYDIVDSFKLLEKYIDQPIAVETQDSQRYEGTLLSASDNIILQSEDGAVTMLSRDQIRNVDFPALPKGLRTRPSLVWLIDAGQAGDHDTQVAYITNGMGWNADYVMLLNQDNTAFDLNGWVTLDNRSGATYTDAKLKLVAGDVNIAAQPEQVRYDMMAMAEAPAAAPAVEQRGFFEYHLYEVQRPVTVKNNQTKQIEFVTGAGVPVTKFYVYNGAAGYGYYGSPIQDQGYGADTGNSDVSVMLEFRTDAESNLETQLPAGRIRMYQEDVDGSPLLVGEDTIDHTPKDETVRLTVGNAFDVVGERVQTDYRRLGESGAEETFRITLRNHKDEDIDVQVVENLYRSSNWTITSQTVDGAAAQYEKLDSNTVQWTVPVPADGEAELIYTVQYLWK